MAYELSVQTGDARLIYLALSYHLARPGSEVDPGTLATTEHGLREVAESLHPHLNDQVSTVALSPYQLRRLGQAMLGTVNELKAYPMFKAQSTSGNAVSAVAGFDDMLATLFPEIEEDENVALDLAQTMMMLRRRLESAIAEAEASEAQEEAAAPAEDQRPPKWQFWRR